MAARRPKSNPDKENEKIAKNNKLILRQPFPPNIRARKQPLKNILNGFALLFFSYVS